LALIIHLADGGAGPVSEDATLRALAWGDYLETHAERAYSSVSRSDASTAKAILSRIKKGDLKTPFTSRDVWRPGWSKLSDRDQVMGGLRMLEDYQHLYIERVNTDGRPKTLYHLNEGE
jgi:putative DNA primase/helicase